MEAGVNPFPYFIIDDYLPYHQANAIYDSLRNMRVTDKWYQYNNPLEKKFANDKWESFPRSVRDFFERSFRYSFVNELELITETKGLICDHKLRGAGIHWIEKGGKLDIHKDFTMHPDLKLIRKFNVILYLNHDWEPNYGGELELWSRDMSVCVKSIEPKFNRLVIFATDSAPHGHTNPWESDTPRMSLALYYYQSPTIDDLTKEHLSTQFLKKPDDKEDPEVEKLRALRNRGRISSNVT